MYDYNCGKCGGLVPEPMKAYGYSGRYCGCENPTPPVNKTYTNATGTTYIQKRKPMNKIISNYKYVLLNKHNTYQYIVDSQELERLKTDGTIKEGDVIIKLDEENTKVARLINKIEI